MNKENFFSNGEGETYNIVCNLLKDYYFKGHHVYMDNYYSSPKLF